MVGWRAQDTEMIEVFAGTANTTRCFRYASYKAVKFDILYKNGKKRQHKSDFMNILDPSGFLLLFSVLENSQITPWSLKTRSLKQYPVALEPLRLICIFVLKGKSDPGFLTLLATKCSSWGPVNRGTSNRSACCSIGHVSFPSVFEGNMMTERTHGCV